MCNAAVGQMGLSLMGAGAGMFAANAEARAAKDETYLQQRAALMSAADAEARGAQEAGRARMATSQLVARQRTAYANSGVDPTKGTAAKTQADTRTVGELDALTIENNAAREAWGLRREAAALGVRMQNIEKMRRARMAGTLLAGAGNAAASYWAAK